MLWFWYLSVCDQIRETCLWVAGMSAFPVIIGPVMGWAEGGTETRAIVKRWMPWALCAWTFVLLAGMLTPTKDSLIQAYLMIEGAKVVNADVAAEAATALGEKVDRFIEALRNK